VTGTTLTMDQVLSASLTKLTLGKFPSESSTVAVNRSYPDSIARWSTFDPTQFTLQQTDGRKLSVPELSAAELEVRNEAGMESRFGTSIAKTLNQFGAEIGTIMKRSEAPHSPSSKTTCDEICYDDKRVFAVQEMKLFNNLSDMPDIANEIAVRYGNGRRLLNEERDRKWCRVVAQTHGYMLDQSVRYGIISCYNRTWFLHSLGAGHIEVSDAFACDSGQLIRAYACFMKLAKVDSSELVPVSKENRQLLGGAVDGSDCSDDSPPDDTDGDPDYCGNSQNGKKRPPSGSSSSGSGGSRPKRTCAQNNKPSSGAAVHPNHVSELNMALCHGLVNIGEGRSGIVISCVYNGVDIAVKLVDRNKGDVKTLEQEKRVYMLLMPLQGRCVPAVVSYNVVSRGGTMVGFAMEKLDPLPDDFAQWSVAQRRGAFNALQSLSSLGVIHGDIRGANFGLRGDEVVVFDFESVSQSIKPRRYPPAFRRDLKLLSALEK
jgi:predicted Ser/Thr protein kinase